MVLAAFSDFMQQVVSGLASGGIYALLALALVIIHRSTGVINFAQGEMATLSTYIAWALIAHHGWRYGPAFVATLALSFVGGVGIHRVVIRPVERGSVLRDQGRRTADRDVRAHAREGEHVRAGDAAVEDIAHDPDVHSVERI